MTKLTQTQLILPAAHIEDENPLPVFRDLQVNREVKTDGTFPGTKLELLGSETGLRVLPYRMQDQYSRQLREYAFQASILENQYLKATFLPELGGRLVSLFDYTKNRELLFFNPVFQPANLAIRNAWFAGGIEWNIAQFGHTFHTCSPVFAAEIDGFDNSPGLRLYEFERCKGLFWQIDFHLPGDSPALIAHVRVINPNPEVVPMYWWTNIAVPELKGQRVLAPTHKAIFMHAPKSGQGFGYADLPYLPSLEGNDGTYSLNYPFANEFFFQCDETDFPWEAALDPNGYGLVEASSPELRYRKMFCWGDHPGGRHWQSFLSQPGMAYLEIQSGLAPTQLHGIMMPGETTWDWIQAFGALQVDPAIAHHKDWQVAKGLDEEIKRQLRIGDLDKLEAEARVFASLPSSSILSAGSGWGALELRRRTSREPLPFFTTHSENTNLFPESTLGSEQRKWLNLSENGFLPEQPPDETPGEWMVQPQWEELLAASVKEGKSDHWLSWLHLGVMRMERFDFDSARQAWQTSLERSPNAWAWRNLAVLALREGKSDMALEYYQAAWSIASSPEPEKKRSLALAIEYLQELINQGEYPQALGIYSELTREMQIIDRVQILLAKILLELGEYGSLEPILKREYAVVQEGETGLTDVWFDMWSRKLYGEKWQSLDPEKKAHLQAIYPPPETIDFRMS